MVQFIFANGPAWIQALAAVVIVLLSGWTLIVLREYAADTKTIARTSTSQSENSLMPFLAVAMQPNTAQQQGGWMVENQGFGPAINISYSIYDHDVRTMRPMPPVAMGAQRFLHNEISDAVEQADGFELRYESLSGLRYGTSVTWANNIMRTQFHKAVL